MAITKRNIVNVGALGFVGVVIIISTPQVRAQPGDAIAISKCQTISKPGSYELINNITFTATSGICLNIAASNVTLDLNGFEIAGPSKPIANQPLPTAIEASNATVGIVVRNGSISGFGSAVALSGLNSIVEEMRVSDGPYLGIGASGIVRNNTVTGISGGPGQGYGISATGVISGNNVSGSRYANFNVGQGSTVIGNTADTSKDPGVGFIVVCPSVLVNNTAINNHFGNLDIQGDGCVESNNASP